MADRTLVLVDAGMAAGFRVSKPTLHQLHQALVHLYRQHPDADVAVLGDPALKWDVPTSESSAFEGDIVAGALVCAPAGALDGTAGFLARTAAKASKLGYDVIAFTDRAIPDVALGRLRNESGRWLWDLDATRTLDATQVGPPIASSRRRRRR
jgi:hypothetical protein